MATAGDVDMTTDFFLLPVSKNATAAIAKGNIVTLSAGRAWQSGDAGPYGVAREAIASGADMKGKVVINGVVWVLSDTTSINQFTAVSPSAAGKVIPSAAQTATLPSGATTVTSTSANPAITLAGTPPYILGMGLDATTSGQLLRVLLDF